LSYREDAVRVRVEFADHIAVVTLNRPERHNGLDGAMFRALVDAQDQVAGDDTVRAVVLTGAGPSFCAGLDVQAVAAEGPGPEVMFARQPGSTGNFAQRAAYGWTELAVPVIAALHGNCLGGGFQLAMAADIRIAAPDLRLAILEIEYGLIPDMGLTQSIPRLLPVDRAKELVWTGRAVGAEEALRLGLVTRLDPDPLSAALALATEIATKSPAAIRAGKHLLTQAWNAPAGEGLLLEETLQKTLLPTAPGIRIPAPPRE
jgi:enoyl-CoA hydratase/carnithine racemase